MPTYTQAERIMQLSTPLGEDVLLLEALSGEEGMSMPFRYTLEMVSENAGIAPDDLLRQPASVTITLSDGGERTIHGLINRFGQYGRSEGLTNYRAELVPWLWFLSLSTDCKIFQNKSVIDIVREVFDGLGFSDYRFACTSSYPPREYCVQYRETHLAFISRLLEDEGIFYFFEHTADKHTLVVADASSAVAPCPGATSMRMSPRAEGDVGTEVAEVVKDLWREHGVSSGKVTLTDYDFLKPLQSLESRVSGDQPEELYDYPGKYVQRNDGDRYARVRLEEAESLRQTVRGTSNVRGLQSGHRFDLEDHYRRDTNQTYQVLYVRHSGRNGGYRASDSGSFMYRNEFTATPHATPYRPRRQTPKPTVQGSQTAVVVGPGGEEIWVDKYGRVKIQFHWDRMGKKNESSSCWVRVSTIWAGKTWGAIQIPRIGQEIVVDFLEGDPDQPLITGRVYNADQMPPYTLPANQTQSGVKSRSSKGGGTENFNELRFEDKKGSEQIVVHAEKDLLTTVENDETRTVGHDRTTTIKNNDTKTVTDGNDVVTIKKGDQTVTVEMGKQAITVQGDQTTTIKQGNHKLVVDMGNQSTQIKMGNQTVKLDLGKSATEAMQSIELKVGMSSIKVDQTGVTIKGMNIKIEGTVQTEMNGLMTKVNGNAMLMLKGGLTMVN